MTRSWNSQYPVPDRHKIDIKGYFSSNYELAGSDWLAKLPEGERQAFSWYGRSQPGNGHGRVGGFVRAKTARRDVNGRFLPNPPRDTRVDCDECAF